MIGLSDGVELFLPPVTSRMNAACDRDECCVAAKLNSFECGIKGLSRNSDGFQHP